MHSGNFVPGFREHGWVRGGALGVDLFFVLSGFLITSLLLNERHRSGTVSLRAFYGRRARRLLPALLTLVGVVGLVEIAADPSRAPEFLADAALQVTYAAN